jgi:hypothetical protein
MITKKTGIKIFLIVEIALFTYGYTCGGRGLMVLRTQWHRNNELMAQIARDRQALSCLEHELLCWQQDPFYKERYARETLHMGRPDERVYLINS